MAQDAGVASQEPADADAEAANAEAAETETAEAETAETETAETETAEAGAAVTTVEEPGRRSVWRRRLRLGFQALSVLTVVSLLPALLVRAQGDDYVRTVQDVPAEPVAIVFGAFEDNDVPSPYLASRLNVALALWHAHKIKVFLVSGDNSQPDYNEPKAMRDYLTARGVPEDLIVLDYAGFDSWQTCDRARQVFGVTGAIVVSQSFHVPRAVFLCRAAGIDAYAVGDGDAAWRLGHDEYANDVAREALAGPFAMYQALLKPEPEFPGPPDDGVAKALKAAGAGG